jgi:predicted lipoprotein with Yx(FWY)xxD motif
MFKTLTTIVVLSLSVGAAFAHESAPPPAKKGPQASPVQVVSTERGTMFVDAKGMTLYYFDKDDSGTKSNCTGKCNERWLPYTAASDAQPTGDFTLVNRDDGSRMWAYRYRPLYTSQADKTPGDSNGADASTLWHIARPSY